MKVERTIEMDVNAFEVGDVISFQLKDGEEVRAMAMKQKADGMIFCFVECLQKKYQMNDENTNRCGYDRSQLREKLNSEILDRFPEEIKNDLVAFNNGDLLRLPTEYEVFGRNIYGECEDINTVEQWKPMTDCRNRLTFIGDSLQWWWLQNKAGYTAASFASVYDNGYACCNGACFSLGVRPVFKIRNL